MKTWKRFATASAIALAVSFSGSSFAGDVTIDEIVNDSKSVADVLTYGLGQEGQRFSTLNQINPETISRLVPAWTMSLGDEKMRGQETQPLVRDGVLYFTGSYSRVYAVDAKTGKKKWQYTPKLPEGLLTCCDVINRGGALYGNNF